jgi:coenzyme F420-reducing hydrogenase gamma subunit
MDYEPDINIRQYSTDGNYNFTLKVTDVMNMDYYYDGSAPTLEDVMNYIKIFLKNHQN